MDIQILYEDRRILVAVKPAGVLSTNEPGGMPELLRGYLGDPQACVRTVHRLDQVVGGVMVFARSAEAARRLSGQMERREFQKEYYAVVHGTLEAAQGTFRDLLARDGRLRRTYVAENPGKDVREAILDYRLLASNGGLSAVAVRLHTGRTHQIRVQFSSRNLPLAGDRKYGEPDGFAQIALWSHSLCFTHPETGETVAFSAPPPDAEPWTRFRDCGIFR